MNMFRISKSFLIFIEMSSGLCSSFFVFKSVEFVKKKNGMKML